MRPLEAEPREDHLPRAILYMLLALCCFTGIDASVKLLGQALPAQQIVFVRYAGQLLLVLAMFLPLYGTSLFVSRAPLMEGRRAVFVLLSSMLNFVAVQHLPLATLAAIAFTIPLFIAALSVPLLGERVGPRRWAAIVVGFLGVLVIIRPGASTLDWAGLLSLAAALCGALYNIETRKLAGVDAVTTQMLYICLLPTFASLPLALMDWHWPTDAAGWLVFCTVGAWGLAGHRALAAAMRRAPAAALAPFIYAQIISNTAAGYLLFGDRPDTWVFLGTAIVIAAGLYVWFRERQLAGGR